MGGRGGNLGTSLCFQTPVLEPSQSFLPKPLCLRLHTSLPPKPQFRVSHGGAVMSGTVNTGGWVGLGYMGNRGSSETRLCLVTIFFIAEGLWLTLWSLGTLSVLVFFY